MQGVGSGFRKSIGMDTIYNNKESANLSQTTVSKEESAIDEWSNALALCQSKAYKEAFPLLESLAMTGHVKAQFALGNIYLNGLGVKSDFKLAMEYLKAASEGGDARAPNNIGYMYFYGLGVTLDYNEAMKWYKESADRGSGTSYFNIGMCYRLGASVSIDNQQAIQWFLKAAEHGVEKAFKGIAVINPDNVKFAKDSTPEVQYQLGLMYKEGKLVQQSDTKTIELLSMADKQGHPEAQFQMGESYRLRTNLRTQSNTTAMKHYKNAALNGHQQASLELVKLQMKEKLPEETIINTINLAMELKHPEAEVTLADWYVNRWKPSERCLAHARVWYGKVGPTSASYERVRKWIGDYDRNAVLTKQVQQNTKTIKVSLVNSGHINAAHFLEEL